MSAVGPEPDGAPPAARTFGQRLLGAARLDPQVYEEVEADGSATMQALAVVVLTSIAAGIGARRGWNGLVVGMLASLGSWYIWAFLTWWIGTRLLPTAETSATHGELLRTFGFASAPGMIQILGVLPPLRGLSIAVAAIWMLVAGVVAVRQALDYRSTWRAVAVVGIGWFIQWLALLVVMGFARMAF